LVQIGRQIHRRIVTWIINKIVKTCQTAIFVVIAFLINGSFPIDDGKVILLLFLVDFVTLALATDNVTWSKKPEKWDIWVLVSVGTILGIASTLETFGIYYIGIYLLKLGGDAEAIYTYVFNIFFFFGIGTIFSVRQRSWFWKSRPSLFLAITMLCTAVVIVVISSVGIPTFMKAIPIQYIAIVMVWCLGCATIVNDSVKVLTYFVIRKLRNCKKGK
jgi:H+-transporting ATPase